MAKKDRSINEPSQRCACGAKAHAVGNLGGLRCECDSCGTTTQYYHTSTEACKAWDRGERVSAAEFWGEE